MPISINNIKGVSSTHARTLKKHGLGNSDKYLVATRTAQMRRELASKLRVEEKMVLEHANRCDLARIKGVGVAFSNLLEDAGVDTVRELANRVPQNLHEKMMERNKGKRIAHRHATMKEVESWVKQAKSLPTMLEY